MMQVCAGCAGFCEHKASHHHREREQSAMPCSKKKTRSKENMFKRKKEQGAVPCSKIVSTLFPRKFGFALD
jgi:hypothetical protein